MVEQRKDRRSPASLKVKYKSASVEQFVEQFSADVSLGGIFLKTKAPLEIGALIKLELQLSDASAVIQGLGRVCWRRMPGPDPLVPSGMGIRFVNLAPDSRVVVERMVGTRGARASRFEQTQGAEVEPASAAAADADLAVGAGTAGLVSAAPPAPVAAPSVGSPSAAAPPATLPRRPPGVRADVPTTTATAAAATRLSVAPPSTLPKAPVRTGPAGLFADSPLARNNLPEAHAGGIESSERNSFFPPEPKSPMRDSDPRAPAADGRRSALPHRPATRPATGGAQAASSDRGSPTSPTRESKALPFGAFGGSGAGESVGTSGRASHAAAPVPERDLIDQLFDDVVQASLRPPAPSLTPAAAPTPAGASTPAPTPIAIGRITPSRPPPAIADADPDPWSTPSRVPSGAPSVPSARDSARSPTPFRTSQPAAPVDAPDEPSDEAFGEADLFDSKSIAAPPANVSVHPQQSALQEFGAPKASSPILWIVLAVIGMLAGGGYYYYDKQQQQEQQLAVDEAKPEPPKSAPVQAPPAVEPAAAAAAPAVEAVPEPTAPTAPAEPAAALPAAAGPMESVEMEVSSLPRGADVLIDGNPTGATPMRITLPLGRTAQITARSAGFASATQTITALKNPEPLRFNLEPLPYAITVRSVPPEAALDVGARTAIAPGPLELGHLDGVVQVGVSKTGFQRMSRLVRLDEFTEQDGVMRAEIEVSLSPLPGFADKTPQALKPKKPVAKKPRAAGAAPATDPSAAPSEAPAAPKAPAASPLLDF